MKKEIKKETQIGDIVAKISQDHVDRFKEVEGLRKEAYILLVGCSKADKRLWEDLIREHSLSEKLGYKIDFATGNVIVTTEKEAKP